MAWVGSSLVGHFGFVDLPAAHGSYALPFLAVAPPQANKDEIKARIAQIKKELAETDSGEQFQQSSANQSDLAQIIVAADLRVGY